MFRTKICSLSDLSTLVGQASQLSSPPGREVIHISCQINQECKQTNPHKRGVANYDFYQNLFDNVFTI